MRPIISLMAIGLLVTAVACSGGDKEAFRNVDHNKDGKVSYEELLFVFPDITPDSFRQMDLDNDGMLSESEYAEFLKKYAAADKGAGKGQPTANTQTATQGKGPDNNPPAVPFHGEEVIEIAPPAADSGHGTALTKGKGKKDQKNKKDAATKGEATQYTVAKGDNLSRIAQRFGLTVEDITKANGNMAPDTLRDGQVLNIPARP